MKRIVIALVALSLLSACKKSPAPEAELQESEQTEATTGSEPEAANDDTEAAEEDTPPEFDLDPRSLEAGSQFALDALGEYRVQTTVDLKDAGQAPRRLLGIQLANLAEEVSVVETSIRSETMGQTMDMPLVTTTLRSSELQLNGDRLDLRLESEQSIETKSKDPQMEMVARAMQQQMGRQRMVMKLTVDNMGRPLDTELVAYEGNMEDTVSTAVNAIKSSVPPVPTKPVGQGATWISKTRVQLGQDLEISVDMYCTLRSLTDDEAVIDIRIEAPELLKVLNASNEHGLKVDEATLTGEGTITVRNDRLFPQSDQTMRTRMTMSMMGEKMDTVMEVRVRQHPGR